MRKTTLCYLKREGKTLLLHRNKRPGDLHQGKYVGLGGKFEAGETPHACMVREVREESGLEVLSARLHGIIDFPAFDGEVDIRCWIYSTHEFEGRLQENEEGSLHWVEDEKVLEMPCWPGDRIFLPWLQEPHEFYAIFYYEKGEYRGYELRKGVSMNPKLRISMEDGRRMDVELYRDIAPETVDNFLKLVDQKFYDGLIFHRVIEGFMIQGGCPEGTGRGGPGWNIKGEFSSNGFANNLRHTRGVLSMARAMDPNSAGSQFFIMHKDAPHLDGQYAAFGKLIDGFDVLDQIASCRTASMDRPVEEQRIESIRLLQEPEEL